MGGPVALRGGVERVRAAPRRSADHALRPGRRPAPPPGPPGINRPEAIVAGIRRSVTSTLHDDLALLDPAIEEQFAARPAACPTGSIAVGGLAFRAPGPEWSPR